VALEQVSAHGSFASASSIGRRGLTWVATSACVASAAVARVLIVGGGCRGRSLAERLVEDAHAVRITTRAESGRAAIEAVGAECLVGTPDRLATLRGALEGVTIACWLLATARGEAEQLSALHGPRLESFVGQAIDTTVRGFVYEAAGGRSGGGERIVGGIASRNAIPLAIVRADPRDLDRWLTDARSAVASLLGV
jgi:hypothetical protein